MRLSRNIVIHYGIVSSLRLNVAPDVGQILDDTPMSTSYATTHLRVARHIHIQAGVEPLVHHVCEHPHLFVCPGNGVLASHPDSHVLVALSLTAAGVPQDGDHYDPFLKRNCSHQYQINWQTPPFEGVSSYSATSTIAMPSLSIRSAQRL